MAWHILACDTVVCVLLHFCILTFAALRDTNSEHHHPAVWAIWICKLNLKCKRLIDKDNYFKRGNGCIVTFLACTSRFLSKKILFHPWNSFPWNTKWDALRHEGGAHAQNTYTCVYRGTHNHTRVPHSHSTCVGAEQNKDPLFCSLCGFNAMGHCLWECNLPEHFMHQTHKPQRLKGTTYLCIKAINNIIGLVILFQTSKLLAHSVAVKDNVPSVISVRGSPRTL